MLFIYDYYPWDHTDTEMVEELEQSFAEYDQEAAGALVCVKRTGGVHANIYVGF